MENFDKDELKNRLTEDEYRITQEGGTEPPFSGEYVDKKDDGMYTCKVCGAELFDSETKFNSGSGWPSFFKSLADKVLLRQDSSMGMTRDEVVCANCGSHLGHVFSDAPDTPTGDRFCINSQSLSFKEKDTDKE